MTDFLDELYSFTERRFTGFNHSLRIYVHGAEVSRWLKGSVTVTYNGRDSYNTASFELSNPRKVWQVTSANLNGEFRNAGEYSEAPKSVIFGHKNNAENSPNFNLDTKQSILGSISTSKNADLSRSITSRNPFFLPPDKLEERRYRLAINDCIFNKNDWVRIFQKNPMSSGTTQWVEVFCGFVQEHPVTTNHLTGESTVTVSCSCIKQQMTKMRVQSNVHKAELDPGILFNKGFYRDFLYPGLQTHPFATSSFEDTIKTLILGSPLPTRDQSRLSPASLEAKQKIGDFKLGNIVCYDPASPGNALERWHLMSVFGVNKVPFPIGGGKDDMWLTADEMRRIGEATYPASKQEGELPVSGPTGRYLHMILPIAGSGPHSLVQYDVIASSVSQAREWTNRWEIIREFAGKIDFQVLTSPSGDILVEFPQYGFTPCAYLTNFGSVSVTAEDSAGTVAVKTKIGPNKQNNSAKGSPKGFPQCDNTKNSIANLFVFDIHQKEETLNDEAEDFPTILQVGGGFAWNQLNTTQHLEVHSPRAYVYSPVLVSRYGVISESVDFPYAGQRATDLGTDSSALTRRLAQLGLVEYTKRMADASTWQGSLVYRPFLLPNRPIHLKKSARMGLLTSVSYTWTVGQSVAMTVNCNMLMAERHDGSYRLLTGSVNTPIDYGAIWSSGGSGGLSTTGVGDLGSSPIIPQAQDSSVQATVQETKDNDVVTNTKTKALENIRAAQEEPNNAAALSFMYPKFAERIKGLMSNARLAGIPLTISSTNKTNAKADPLSDYFLGLGCDMVIQGLSEAATIQKVGEIATINNEHEYELVIRGSFEKMHVSFPEGPWHYTLAKAQRMYQLQRNAGDSERSAIEQVWHAIDSHNPGFTDLQDQASLPSENLAQIDAAADQAPELAQQEGGTIKEVKPCANSQDFLREPGLRK